MYRKTLFIFVVLLPIFPLTAYPKWTYPINNYVRNDYKAGSQNWQIIQRQNHWMYFANKMGILEFNGNDWKLYALNNATDVRSLMKSSDDKRVYVGGIGELGYLEPQPNGQMKYHCISSQVPHEALGFGNIWNIYEIDRSIYFCADFMILRLTDGEMKVISCPDKIDCSNIINGTIYIGSNSGIYVLAGDFFHKIPGLESLKNKKLRGIFPFDKQILLATALDGLFLLDGEILAPLTTQADAFMKKNELFSVAVSEKIIAVGTVLNGVVTLTHAGEIIGYFNESHGLHNNTVLSLFFDKGDNLWLGLDNGIARIGLNSPVTYLYTPPNFYGAGYAAAIYNGKLYLGTNRGLFYVDWPVSSQETAPALKLVENMQGQVWSLNRIGDDLICCLDKGLYIMKGNTIRNLINHTGVWKCTLTNANGNQAFVSTYNGFYLMEKKDNQWQTPVAIDNFQGSYIHFEEKGNGTLFVKNTYDEMFKLTLNESKTKIDENQLYQSRGGAKIEIPQNFYIYKINNQIKLSSPEGIYTCNENDRFIPDERLNDELNINEHLSFKSLYDVRGNIWTLGADVVGVYYPNTKHFFSCRHNIPLITNFENLVVLNEVSAIICNENGFALWNVTPQNMEMKDVEMQIIRVDMTTPTDSLIYMNNDNRVKTIPKIAYKNNSLRFKFDLIHYSDNVEPLFRCKLDAEKWSDYSFSTIREYTNISIGKHIFKVETKRAEGVVFSDEFTFVILPPWYRTNTAYAIYVFLLVATLFTIWFWDDKRIKDKEKHLKAEQQKAMQEKEEVYKKESEKKEQEIIRLKNEQLEMEVKHKNQELANSAINLARKNEVLLEIKGDINKISDELMHEDGDNLNIISLRRMFLRLNNKVDDNFVQDDSLKKFEEHFDLVHNNFMQRLSEKYPSLTMNERKMCAFIKMNLSSKEIAPLLNISIRGVETLRYRLRKKIGLHPDESLTSFLGRF